MHGLKSYILEGTYLVLTENQVTRKKSINGIVVSTPHTWASITVPKRAKKKEIRTFFHPKHTCGEGEKGGKPLLHPYPTIVHRVFPDIYVYYLVVVLFILGAYRCANHVYEGGSGHNFSGRCAICTNSKTLGRAQPPEPNGIEKPRFFKGENSFRLVYSSAGAYSNSKTKLEKTPKKGTISWKSHYAYCN